MGKCLKFICLIIILTSGPLNVSEAQYPFIRYELNKITLPADSTDWLDFSTKIKAARHGGKLNILHFGDSHIQGDYFTGQVRKQLFNYLGIKLPPRGITMPYRVAGTNGPDELFSNSHGYVEATSVRKGYPAFFALSGYRISACDSLVSISLKDTSNYRFNKVSIFHNRLKTQKLHVNETPAAKVSQISDSLVVSIFILDELTSEVNLKISNSSTKCKTYLYGFALENDQIEVSYNSIGVNGATFNTFLNLQDTKNLVNFLKADCIIFSYGTNDALFRTIDTTFLKKQLISGINLVRSANSDIPILFTTPGDFLINKQVINPKTALVSKIIRETAIENNCGYWDFYTIMGGNGSVREWYKKELMFKDWIHLSKKGYRVQGDLFFDALLKLKDLKKS